MHIASSGEEAGTKSGKHQQGSEEKCMKTQGNVCKVT